MEPRIRSRFSALVAFLTVLLFNVSAVVGDFTQSYCSTQNTGSTDVCKYCSVTLSTELTVSDNWTWQSNSKCTEHCQGLGNFAFAVIKFDDCWCSNYIPAQQVDIGGCQKNCPGWQPEKCGDKDKGLYIYIKMNGAPSGTQGSSQPSSSVSVTPLRSSEDTSSVQATTVSTLFSF